MSSLTVTVCCLSVSTHTERFRGLAGGSSWAMALTNCVKLRSCYRMQQYTGFVPGRDIRKSLFYLQLSESYHKKRCLTIVKSVKSLHSDGLIVGDLPRLSARFNLLQ